MNNVQPIDPKYNIPASHSMTAIVPRNMDEVWRLAQAVSLSGLAPNDMKTPEKVMVAILHGMEIGLKPMQAIQRIAVINGRPSLWGDAALGLVRASSLMASIKEGVSGEGNARFASCTVARKGEDPVSRSFSVQDAITAGLWGKDIWKKYPDRMLSMRARGYALRDVFPDVLGGMYLAEELQGETIDAPAIPTPPTPPPSLGVAQPVERLTVNQDVAGSNPASQAKLAEGPDRSARGEFVDKTGVEIPLGALNDFDAFQNALNSCPTLESLNAMFEALTRNMADPSDIEEAQNILREVAAKFPMEDEDQTKTEGTAADERANDAPANRSQSPADYRGAF